MTVKFYRLFQGKLIEDPDGAWMRRADMSHRKTEDLERKIHDLLEHNRTFRNEIERLTEELERHA